MCTEVKKMPGSDFLKNMKCYYLLFFSKHAKILTPQHIQHHNTLLEVVYVDLLHVFFEILWEEELFEHAPAADTLPRKVHWQICGCFHLLSQELKRKYK